MSEVMAIGEWSDNADLMVDVARLGYLDGVVFDATYGEGTFWRKHLPGGLVTNDRYKPADCADDYRHLRWPDKWFDTVVYDPPYKLSGTPSLGRFDDRYGINDVVTNNDRLADIVEGVVECWRVAAKYLLVKCQDQVAGGRVRWQTDLITWAIEGLDGTKVDRFDLAYRPRPQPNGRTQQHARRNHSTLLVFSR